MCDLRKQSNVDLFGGSIRCVTSWFAICSIIFTFFFTGLLVNFGLNPVWPIMQSHPSGFTSEHPHDPQIYEVILTIVYAKQIIGRDEWVTLVMKLHQP